jgi:hypothetical protein
VLAIFSVCPWLWKRKHSFLGTSSSRKRREATAVEPTSGPVPPELSGSIRKQAPRSRNQGQSRRKQPEATGSDEKQAPRSPNRGQSNRKQREAAAVELYSRPEKPETAGSNRKKGSNRREAEIEVGLTRRNRGQMSRPKVILKLKNQLKWFLDVYN